MTDTATAPASGAVEKATPVKKSAAKKTGAARNKPTHPPTSEMVNNAIKNLKERGGSSLQAIKKYTAANYKVDSEKLAPFIKKYLKAAVTNGSLVQTKGKGASGSFKLAAASKQGSSDSTAAPKKTKRAVKEKKAVTTKATGVAAAKKAAAAKKQSTVKSAKKSAASTKKSTAATPKSKPSTPSKAKKATKGPTKKPKAPKPKKASAKVAKSPKKTAAKKK